ncbi:MAG: hypothetical protein ACLUYV_03275 [Alistipes shahii]
MQRSATSCFAKHIAAFLVRPFGEYPAFLVLTALLPLIPDIIRFFLNEMSFVPGRNLFYGTLLSLFRAWLLVLPLCLRQHDRGGEILAVRIAEAIYRVFVLSYLGLLSLAESFLLIRFGTPFSFSVIQLSLGNGRTRKPRISENLLYDSGIPASGRRMRPADRRVSAGGTPEDSVRTAQPQGTHIAPIPAGRQRRLLCQPAALSVCAHPDRRFSGRDDVPNRNPHPLRTASHIALLVSA